MKKRTSCLALAAAAFLAFGLLPASASAQEGDLPELVAGTSQSGTGWSWDGEQNILTLDGFSSEGVNGFQIKKDATVVLKGQNQFTGNANQKLIAGFGDLTIQGDGTLTADNSEGLAADGDWQVQTPVIFAIGTMTIAGGEMEIVGGFEGNDGIVISGGKMTFHTPDGLELEEYISPTHAFFTLGTVEITGGVLDIYLGKYDTGFYVANYTGTGHDKADIAISGGSISVEGGDQALMVQYVPEKSGDKPAVEITGGSFTADTGSYAIRSYYGGDVVIRDGEFDFSGSAGVAHLDRETDELKIAAADYSEVDEALAEAQALDSADYEDFSAVTKAVEAVERGLDITRQKDVDAMAQAIREAMGALTEKDTEEIKDDEDITATGISLAAMPFILLTLSGAAVSLLLVYSGKKRRVQ